MHTAKPKPDPKPVTAQVPDYCMPFGIDTRGKEHFDKHDKSMVSDNERTQAPGCYRRLPTCRD